MSTIQNMNQVAGNSWGNPPLPMLHEVISVDPTRDIDFSYANSMFDDMERQMCATETEFSQSIKELREKFVFRNTQGVEYFVRAHRTVAPLLIEAAPQLAAAFGNQALIFLEILPGDETPDSIYAITMWNGDGAEARAALHTFDQGWLARNFQVINGRIVFDYELI